MRFSKHYLAACSAYILWGIVSLLLKPLAGYPSLDILFYRVFFSAAVLCLLNAAFRRKVIKQRLEEFRLLAPSRKKRTIWLSLSGGLLLIINWLSFIFVMNHVSINAASFAYLICPIITTLLAYFILNETLGTWQWVAVAISVISCILLSLESFNTILYSLIVSVSYALYLVSQRKNDFFDRFTLMTIQVLIASAALLPLFPSYASPLSGDTTFHYTMLVIVLFFTILPLYLSLYALSGISSSMMGILIYMNPLVNFLIAVFYFNEKISLMQFLGYSMTVLSILIFNKNSDESSANVTENVTYTGQTPSDDTRETN